MKKKGIPLGTIIIVLFFTLVFLSQCEIKTNCRSPQLGETNNIKDALFVNGKLIVLSSPQDVLTWCSSFITVYSLEENGNFTPTKVVELSGKVAKKLGHTAEKIIATFQDKEEIEILDKEVNTIGKINLQLPDIYHLAYFGNSFAISSYIDSKILIVNDSSKFFESVGSEGKQIFHVRDISKLKGFMLSGKFISFIKNKNSVMILPDNKEISIAPPEEILYRSDITSNVLSEQSSFDLVQYHITKKINKKQNTDIMFLHSGSSSGGFVAVPAFLNSVTGILIIFPICLTEFTGSSSQIDQEFERCSVFFTTTPLTEMNVSDFYFWSYRDHSKKIIIFTSFISDSDKNKTIFSLIAYDYENNKFLLSDYKELGVSPLYLIYKANIREEIIIKDEDSKPEALNATNVGTGLQQKRRIYIELYLVKLRNQDEFEIIKFTGDYKIR